MSAAFPVMLAGLSCLAVLVRPLETPGDETPHLPSKVSLVGEFQRFGLIPGAQGDRDVCSLFAVTGAADFEASKHGRPERLSEEFCIWAAHDASGLPGEQAMFYMAVHGLNTFGLCEQSLMPYSSKGSSRTRPSAEALKAARELDHCWRVHWVKRWDVKTRLTDQQLTEIKKALANEHPVACGLRWPKTLSGSDITAVPPPNQVEDGHSILFVGYEDNAGAPGGGTFTFRNSWGAKWGADGYGTMSFAYARTYANDAFWLQIERRGAETPVVRFEAEDLPVLHAERCQHSAQSMKEWGGGMWSRGKQLMCVAQKDGFVDLAFDVKKGGTYRLRVLATAAPDYGIVHMALDGKRAGQRFDLYSGRVSPSGSLELGDMEISAGRHRLRVLAEGKNPASEGFSFGIDAIDLLPIR